jgi:ABC-type amino acid transport system permease subunit
MVNLGVMLVGFIVVALGVLVGIYLLLQRRHGNLPYRGYQSVKSNMTTNTPYLMVALGIAIIGAGWILP